MYGGLSENTFDKTFHLFYVQLKIDLCYNRM